MSTFPVREISFTCEFASSENMSSSRGGARSGFASRPSPSVDSPVPGDVVSPGFSSLSSSSTHPITVLDYKSVWDFENVEQFGDRSIPSSMCWVCHWCNGKFRGWNATKALSHVSKSLGKTDIKACTGTIPIATLTKFQVFRDHKSDLSSAKRQHNEALADRNSENQQSLSIAYQIKRSRSSNSSSTAAFLVDRTGEFDGGVAASNATKLTSAIAEFVYCKGLSFSATEGDQFLQILKLARLVNSSYRPPNRNLLSNELLDISYDNRLDRYLTALDVDAEVYGLSLFGDGATVHGMPLMNILATGVGEPSAILAIVDCKCCGHFIFKIERPLAHSHPFCFCSFERYQPSPIGEEEEC
jgi:hypothetical protein